MRVRFLPRRVWYGLTTKGQVTIPIEIREKLGLLPYTEVEFEIEGDAVKVVPIMCERSVGSSLANSTTVARGLSPASSANQG